MYCSCGNVIPKERIDAVTLNGKFPMPKSLSCVKCAESRVQRVAGYMPSTSKMLGEIVITDQETAKAFHKDAWRAGTGVARGVKN
jgi:hypothetical protein